MTGFAALWITLVAVGLCSRAAPLLDQGGRLLRQFPTEDGYLMLTIARNIALGNGMSIAGGTIPTNGTQPLATYLYAACFALVDGDKTAGVALACVLQLGIACAGAWLLWRIGRRALRAYASGDRAAALAAAVWFASPVVVRHSMNGLESGLYVLTVLLVLQAIGAGAADAQGRPRLLAWGGIGLLLGLAFLARNDAVVLCVAVGLAHLFGALPRWRAPLSARAAELALAAVAALAMAAPWLIHNLRGFGNIVPISGQAESLDAGFGENLVQLPAALFEYVMLVLPIPVALEVHPLVVAGCTLAVAAATAGVLAAAARWSDERRVLALVGGLYALGLCIFYGFFFGAGHFVSRYLLPVSPFLALLWAGAAIEGLRLVTRRTQPTRAAFAVVLVLLVAGLNLRLYWKGERHLHFQVVEWVDQHVPDDTWVGAIQTGTLGFFHDRTINLDGKVNPGALAARKEDSIPAYVVESEIQFLVDWADIAAWIERPELASHFEVRVNDVSRNLAVLSRRGEPSS